VVIIKQNKPWKSVVQMMLPRSTKKLPVACAVAYYTFFARYSAFFVQIGLWMVRCFRARIS
jgi:hypothetical protein